MAQVFGAELGLRLPNPALLAAELLQPPSMRAGSVFTSLQASPVVQLHASLADAVRRRRSHTAACLPCWGSHVSGFHAWVTAVCNEGNHTHALKGIS